MGKWLVVDTTLPPDSRFWCVWEVEGGRARAMEWYEDFWEDLNHRNSQGMSAAAACAMTKLERRLDQKRRWAEKARSRNKRLRNRRESPIIG